MCNDVGCVVGPRANADSIAVFITNRERGISVENSLWLAEGFFGRSLFT